MPSPPFRMDSSRTQITVSLPMTISWVAINNPTGSPILARFGGTDYPTEDSADMWIPMLSAIVVPVSARDFAFTFQNSLALGSPIPQKTAVIIFGIAGESPPLFGSIQQNKQEYYDRPNFKAITSMIGGFIAGLADGQANQIVFPTSYVVPARRKAIMATYSILLRRTGVSTSPFDTFCTVALQPNGPGQVPQLNPTPAHLSGAIDNYIGATKQVTVPTDLPLLTPMLVNFVATNNDNGVGGTVEVHADAYIYEFDA